MRSAIKHKVGIYMFEVISGNPEMIGWKKYEDQIQ